MEKWQQEKADLVELIDQLKMDLSSAKEARKAVPKHVEWDSLPEESRFNQLAPSRKRLMDTVRLVSYRAETALASILQERLKRPDDARSLIRDVLRSPADLLPDPSSNTLHVRLHSFASARQNKAVQHLLDHLNNSDCKAPGSNLTLRYSLAV